MDQGLPPADQAPKPRALPTPAGRFACIEHAPPCADTGGVLGDGLGRLTVVTESLGVHGVSGRGSGRALGRGDVTYWVPPGTEAQTDLPVVVLLHGVYASHWAWRVNAAAHRTD